MGDSRWTGICFDPIAVHNDLPVRAIDETGWYRGKLRALRYRLAIFNLSYPFFALFGLFMTVFPATIMASAEYN